jgi:RNA polymerase sigma factor (sigma-70 family)
LDIDLTPLVPRIKQGEKSALEEFVRLIQDQVYGLALRMLYHPEDAEDACQEILIKVIVHLDSFRGESNLRTWVYRIAANHLLTARKTRAEKQEISFESISAKMDQMAAKSWSQEDAEAYQGVLLEEVRFRCMQGFQQCLDRDHRIAYILGSVLELSGAQGAYILDISPAAFRKRLSRARARLHDFMSSHCGLVNEDNRCSCAMSAKLAADSGRAASGALPSFDSLPRRKPDPDILASIKEMDEMGRMAALLKSYPDLAAPESFLKNLKTMIAADRFDILRLH